MFKKIISVLLVCIIVHVSAIAQSGSPASTSLRVIGKATTDSLAIKSIGSGSSTDSILTIDTSGNVHRRSITISGTGSNISGPAGYVAKFDSVGISSSIIYNTSTGVGIGTNSPGIYKLAVEGTLGARKIKVTQVTPWADYVFGDDYILQPLIDVETYIKINKHLPDVPSAKQVEKEGIDVGDTQALLLKKIEELTLYMIEMKKELNVLKKQNEQLLLKEKMQ